MEETAGIDFSSLMVMIFLWDRRETTKKEDDEMERGRWRRYERERRREEKRRIEERGGKEIKEPRPQVRCLA